MSDPFDRDPERIRAIRRAPRRLVVSGKPPMAHQVGKPMPLYDDGDRIMRRANAIGTFVVLVLIVVTFVAIVAELSRPGPSTYRDTPYPIVADGGPKSAVSKP